MLAKRSNFLPARAPGLRRRLRSTVLGSVVLLASFAPAVAHADDDAPEVYDARVQGYTKVVQLPISSTALTYILLIVLGGISIGVLFMDAKRSHLD